MKYLTAFIAFALVFMAYPYSLSAQGIAFDDDEEEYKIDRDELIELILDIAGDETELFCGRWLKIPVIKTDTSEAALKIARIMETRRVSVSFQDASLEEACTFISDITGINIVLSPQLAESNKTVTLKLKDIKVVNLINLICDADGSISWTIKNEVLYLGMEDEITDAVTKDFVLIDLAEFLVQPPDFKGPDIKVFNPEED